MRKIVYALAVLAGAAGPVAAQEKEFVLDRSTGAVTAKDVEQDKAIADLRKEVADLKAKLASKDVVAVTVPRPAPGVAAGPFVESPCGPGGCLTIQDTTALTAGTPPAARGYSSGPVRYEAPTYTVVRYAGAGGSTSGCANGNCAAPSRSGWYPGKLLGR